MRYILIIYLLLTFAGPLAVILSGKIDFKADYRTANRDSAHLAPDPETNTEAVIQAYSARAFSWRGIFASHTWIAVKPKDAKKYTVYQFIGWRLLSHLSPLVISQDIPDRNWFNATPTLILDIRGEKAERLIPEIANAAPNYPYANEYVVWPGPNSNTFIAYIARKVPDLQLALPSDALGKDYLGKSTYFATTPSGTGFQFSVRGLLGISFAAKEGLEFNLLGLVYGISPEEGVIKLPGFGDFKLKR